MNAKFKVLALLATLFWGCTTDPLKYPNKLPDVVREHADTVTSPEFTVIKTYLFNEEGTSFRVVFQGADGKPINYSMFGVAEVINLVHETEEGTEHVTTYYDTNRKPVVGTDKFAQSRTVFDKKGRYKEIAYYDQNGSLTTSYAKYAKCVYEYNEQEAFSSCVTNYDPKMEVIEPINEYFYNKDTLVVRTNYLNKNKQPIEWNGVAYVLTEYNGSVVSQISSHNLAGKLAIPDGEKAALIKYVKFGNAKNREEYDDNGVLVDVHFDDEDLDIAINERMFSDSRRMAGMFEFIVKARFALDEPQNPFDLLGAWKGWMYNSYTDLNALYNVDKWKDQKPEAFPKAAWDYFGAVNYMENNKGKLLSVFDKIAPSLPKHIGKDVYNQSGLRGLVEILFSAYGDIYSQSDPDECLKRIYNLMIENDENGTLTPELHSKIMELLDSPEASIDLSMYKYEEEGVVRQKIEVWAYSFWARRDHEGTRSEALNILSSIKAMY